VIKDPFYQGSARKEPKKKHNMYYKKPNFMDNLIKFSVDSHIICIAKKSPPTMKRAIPYKKEPNEP
jgi:hypothetical protein